MGSVASRSWGSFFCVEWATVWDQGSGIIFSVYGHRGRRFVVVYGRHGTTTHVGSVFFAWRFSAGDGRCGFAGGMPLVHLVWGLSLRGFGAFVRCYSHHLRVIICVDWAGRLGLAALDGGMTWR